MPEPISVIIPALNEEISIEKVIVQVKKAFKDIEAQIIVVDDGSDDRTGEIARSAGIEVLINPMPNGYGNAIKKGILHSKHDLLAIIDADGTYAPQEFSKLYPAVTEEGFPMAIGARTGSVYQGGLVKRMGRLVFRLLVEFACGCKIPDINTGMRIFRKKDVMPFYDTLSPGFSLSTTLTLAYHLNSLLIKNIPIQYLKQEGNSKVRHFRDSLRALQIIVNSIIYYNPLKIYFVLGFVLILVFLLCGILLLYNLEPIWVLILFILFCSLAIIVAIGFHSVSLSLQNRRMGSNS
jgi:polyisoprenyl-phosphate glycosyltransferase